MKVYTPPEVAQTLRLNVQTIYGYIRDRRLPAVRAGRSYRILEEDLRAFIEGVKTTAPESSTALRAVLQDLAEAMEAAHAAEGTQAEKEAAKRLLAAVDATIYAAQAAGLTITMTATKQELLDAIRPYRAAFETADCHIHLVPNPDPVGRSKVHGDPPTIRAWHRMIWHATVEHPATKDHKWIRLDPEKTVEGIEVVARHGTRPGAPNDGKPLDLTPEGIAAAIEWLKEPSK